MSLAVPASSAPCDRRGGELSVARRVNLAVLGAALVAMPGAAFAQELELEEFGGGVEVLAEVASDERVRGLSWSGGKAAATLAAWVPVLPGIEASAAATTLRGSARHGGADAGLRLGASWSHAAGGWRLGLGATGHVFPGHSALNFAEIEARAAYSLGPATLRGAARYAPSQAAIGGDNLHLSLDADVGLPGTRWTLLGGVGHSTGATDDPLRAARLRPGGAYWNWSLGAERVQGPVVVGARWTGTSIGTPLPVSPLTDEHVGSRIAAYLRLSL